MSETKPYYDHAGITIYNADCRDVLQHLSGIDAVVTDPPYGLEFMGKDWDRQVPGQHFWELIRAACKPGANLLSFGGTRTWHRMAVNIEDAGWEVRDTLCWLHGQGFPKSLDVSKSIDKAAGAERKVVTETKSGGYKRLITANVEQGFRPADYYPEGNKYKSNVPITDTAKQWSGWGTNLKPAFEPIILAMNPLDGTYAANALKHGVAGLNIDGCRIECDGDVIQQSGEKVDIPRGGCHEGYDRPNATMFRTGKPKERSGPSNPSGRWPANVVLDGEAATMLDKQSGELQSGFMSADQQRNASEGKGGYHGGFAGSASLRGTFGDVGGASRFFYVAKANADRNDGFNVKNTHPTVKPLSLMMWLLTLVKTPTGGVILDPFMGSGTTLKAAKDLGIRAIGIEIEEKYCAIAESRLTQEVLL